MSRARAAPDCRPGRLTVSDAEADGRFRALVEAAGRDPDDPWIGGYADYEWNHGRHIFQTMQPSMSDLAVLEFGCNYGGTSIVLAALKARVTALDVDRPTVAIARENAARYGMSDRIDFVLWDNRARLPFADASFDRIVCNSVLEYVDEAELPQVQRELDRVLKPGGAIVVCATSNRLWPVEAHSRRWFSNYVPQRLSRLLHFRGALQRGVWPWSIRYGFGAYQNLDRLDGGKAYLASRERIYAGGAPFALLRVANAFAQRLGVTLGLLTPYMCVTLRKPDVRERANETRGGLSAA
jgi:SAM-dependent methyltransferase